MRMHASVKLGVLDGSELRQNISIASSASMMKLYMVIFEGSFVRGKYTLPPHLLEPPHPGRNPAIMGYTEQKLLAFLASWR